MVVGAAPQRVWRALCEPDQVTAWDGAVPIDVPAGYPQAGQHATWRVRVGGIALLLHDQVRAVEAERRLVATLRIGLLTIDEEYRLADHPGGSLLVSTNDVRAPWGTRRLAAAFVRRSVTRSLGALAALCEDTPA